MDGVLLQAFALVQWVLKVWISCFSIKDTTAIHFQYLGHQLYPKQIVTQKFKVRKDNLLTSNYFQKLLGNINWLRLHLKLTTGEPKPLFDIPRGDENPNSPDN